MNKILRCTLFAVFFAALTPATSRADFFDGLQQKLIQAKDGKAVPYKKEGANPKFTAIYYSAHWCPPCRLFTPKLVEWYNEFQPKHKDFQLVFASSDKDEKAMLEYMTEMKMPWPAVQFAQKKMSGVEKFSADGIPYLVLIDEKGKDLTGKPGNEWQAPAEVLKQIEAIVGGKK
jgi:nucleoredoxin